MTIGAHRGCQPLFGPMSTSPVLTPIRHCYEGKGIVPLARRPRERLAALEPG